MSLLQVFLVFSVTVKISRGEENRLNCYRDFIMEKTKMLTS